MMKASRRPKITAVVTSFYPCSHADVILSKIVHGIPTDDQISTPRVQLCSIYLDQRAKHDVGVEFARLNQIPMFENIEAALKLGTEQLAVDGVLLIGEHGDYPENELGHKLYPRRCFFEQICAVLATASRPIPVYCDKGLAYNCNDFWWMYKRSVNLNIPFMAGSTLPYSYRTPYLDPPLGCELNGGLVIGFGPLESYGFHALETLAFMTERRRGGEHGVSAVRCLEGPAVWQAAGDSAFDEQLFNAAFQCFKSAKSDNPRKDVQTPYLIELEHRDKLHSQVVMLEEHVTDFAFSGRIDGSIQASEFYLQSKYPFAHFNYLALNLEEMYVSGEVQTPLERTLQSSCALDAAMHSRAQGGEWIRWKEMEIAYTPMPPPVWQPVLPRPAEANAAPWPHGWPIEQEEE